MRIGRVGARVGGEQTTGEACTTRTGMPARGSGDPTGGSVDWASLSAHEAGAWSVQERAASLKETCQWGLPESRSDASGNLQS